MGHDREGCPVWIIPLGNMDIKGLLHSAKKMDFIKYTVKMMQESEEDMSVQSERVSHDVTGRHASPISASQLGKKIDTHSFILDMSNFSMKQLAWKPGTSSLMPKLGLILNTSLAVDLVTSLITLFEDHYPERLKKVYVINGKLLMPAD